MQPSPSIPSACWIFKNWNSTPSKQHPFISPAPSNGWSTSAFASLTALRTACKWHLCFRGLLISFSVVPSRFTYAVAHVRISFLLRQAMLHYMYVPLLAYPPRGHCTAGHSSGSVVHSPQRRTRVPVPLSPHLGQHTFFSFVIGALLMDFLVFISLMIRFDFHFPNAQWCWTSFHFTHGYWSFAYLLSSSSLEKCLLNPLPILKSGGFFQWLMFLCFNSCQAYFTWRRVWFEPPI